jgi:hypothetical protein
MNYILRNKVSYYEIASRQNELSSELFAINESKPVAERIVKSGFKD